MRSGSARSKVVVSGSRRPRDSGDPSPINNKGGVRAILVFEHHLRVGLDASNEASLGIDREKIFFYAPALSDVPCQNKEQIGYRY